MNVLKTSIIILLWLFSACDKKTDNPKCTNSDFVIKTYNFTAQDKNTETYKDHIFIINEGGFNYGNASISAYNPLSKTIINNIFFKENMQLLGDVVQSITPKDDDLYIVVNNSQRIIQVDKNSFKAKRSLQQLSSPRYLAFKNDEIALVSDLYQKKIQLINTKTACNEGEIETKGWTEQIFSIANQFWLIERNGIAESEKFANLILIDVEQKKVINRIAIPVEPNSVCIDDANNLWILSSGFESENQKPALVYFNTSTKSITKHFKFDSYVNIPQNIVYNQLEQAIYFNKSNFIYKMSAQASVLPTTYHFENAAQNIYGMHINPTNTELYISDAKNYFDFGKIYRYSTNGFLIDDFEVGYIPSKIYFF